MSASNVDNSTKAKDTLIGRQLGDYRLTSKLASGGMARVYKAMDYKLQRQAAVKVLEKEKAQDDQTLTKRFIREARAVAGLEHENIITIYQYGEEDDCYFLAMKLVKGKDLAAELSRLRKSKTLMDVRRAFRIMEQVAAALDFAHAAGIVHRDVKPSNVLLDKDDKAELTDIGLVLRTSSETTMGTAFGTPRYIAPEQAVSSNKANHQSDIYALGVIFYEILTGETPFNGDSPMEIALSQISDPPPPPRSKNPTIPLKAERELLKALEKDPDKRHSSASEFVRAVKEGYDLVENVNRTPVAPLSEGEMSKLRAASAVEEDNGAKTIGVNEVMKGALASASSARRKRSGVPMLLVGLLAAVLLAAGVFIINGMGGTNTGVEAPSSSTPRARAQALVPVSAGGDGAPVMLIYDANTFTMINRGDYTLEVQRLIFIRGEDDGPDDFSGDRITRDILPAGKCYQISLQGRQATIPDLCRPPAEKRHGMELLQEPRRLHWRSETQGGERIATFEVRYDGQLLAECDTVDSDGEGECRFNWPVVPEDS